MILIEFKNIQDKNTVLSFLNTTNIPLLGDSFLVGKCEITYIKGLDDNISTSDIVVLALTNFTSISLNVIANYIFDFLKKNKDLTISINKRDLSEQSISNINEIIKILHESDEKK